MAGTHFYIDGLNFYYGAVQGSSHKWIDFEAVARKITPRDSIGKIWYFTAPVKPGYPGDEAHQRQDVYLRAIRLNPLIKVEMGHFRSDKKWRVLAERAGESMSQLFRPDLRPDRVGQWLFAQAERRRTMPVTMARVVINEEKGSDVNLGSHLLHDALKGLCDKAVVITNDSDLATPIKLTVASGVPVVVVNPHRTAQTASRLKQVATHSINLRHRILPKCQLPATLVDAKGRHIQKPREWA